MLGSCNLLTDILQIEKKKLTLGNGLEMINSFAIFIYITHKKK